MYLFLYFTHKSILEVVQRDKKRKMSVAFPFKNAIFELIEDLFGIERKGHNAY